MNNKIIETEINYYSDFPNIVIIAKKKAITRNTFK